MATIQRTRPATTPSADGLGDLERALYVAAQQMTAKRLGRVTRPVDLEALADKVITAAITEQHTDVLCSADDPNAPTSTEQRWALSLAGSVANRFQRTARKVLRSLKAGAPAVTIDDSCEGNGCPAWCVRSGSAAGCDWCESRPISMRGPGDFYAEHPEDKAYEVLYAAISEPPMSDTRSGVDMAPYIYFDTLGVGQGDRLNVEQTDAVIKQLVRYVSNLQVLRDQLAYLNRVAGRDDNTAKVARELGKAIKPVARDLGKNIKAARKGK